MTLAKVYNSFPFEIVEAQGSFLWDTDENRYIDFYGGHCVCPIGHSPEVVIDAIHRQGQKFMFYSNLVAGPIREEGAKRVISFAQSGHTHAFFCNSGAEANENAIKIALLATGRKEICSFKGSFHGRTAMAITATDAPKWHEQYSGWLGKSTQLTPNDLTDLEKITDSCAAVILEPIQSIGKCTVFEDQYLTALRNRCNQVGAKLIFDEVQTGIGRTGTPSVSGSCGTIPDMMTMAKGLASGFPIGAVLMTTEISQTLQKGDIAATFGGGPLAMAAMTATLDAIDSQNIIEHVKETEKYIRETFTNPAIQEIKGKGLLLGLVLDRPAQPIQAELFKREIIVGLNSDPNQIHLLPPLNIDHELFDQLRVELDQLL